MNTASPLHLRRQVTNAIALGLTGIATALGLVALVWILLSVVLQGARALHLSLFLEPTPPPGSSGGLVNAILGSLEMLALAILIGTPLGILGGTFLAERRGWRNMVLAIRFLNDILLAAPSIVIGLFVYQVVVRPSHHFSGLAGAVAMAILLVPIVVRTTDETLRLIPPALREAALALGAPVWRMTLSVLYPAARAGILTGVLLGIARIGGETAPLLFTALNSQYLSFDLRAPMANLPVVIFQFALSPYDAWHDLAWAGAFLIMMFVLALNVTARLLLGGARK
jgi:phosphate transport system permease protein